MKKQGLDELSWKHKLDQLKVGSGDQAIIQL